MTIRTARMSDLDTIIQLCREHAAYELADAPPSARIGALAKAIDPQTQAPRLFLWVVEFDLQIVGFAAASLEFSTWQAREYLHLDCLYLRPKARGQGWGTRLLSEARGLAERLGCFEVQWQTPPWNEKAIAFYAAQGARSRPKLRFSLTVK